MKRILIIIGILSTILTTTVVVWSDEFVANDGPEENGSSASTTNNAVNSSMNDFIRGLKVYKYSDGTYSLDLSVSDYWDNRIGFIHYSDKQMVVQVSSYSSKVVQLTFEVEPVEAAIIMAAKGPRFRISVLCKHEPVLAFSGKWLTTGICKFRGVSAE